MAFQPHVVPRAPQPPPVPTAFQPTVTQASLPPTVPLAPQPPLVVVQPQKQPPATSQSSSQLASQERDKWMNFLRRMDPSARRQV